jgi:hypothetical protein
MSPSAPVRRLIDHGPGHIEHPAGQISLVDTIMSLAGRTHPWVMQRGTDPEIIHDIETGFCYHHKTVFPGRHLELGYDPPSCVRITSSNYRNDTIQ